MASDGQNGDAAGGAVLDPATQQFVDWASGEDAASTFAEARALFQRIQSAPAGRPGAEIETLSFDTGQGGDVLVRAVRPRLGRAGAPAILHFPGGWWSLGDPGTHDRLAREIAVGTQAVVFSVGYARPPEARYPVAIEQAYGATRIVATEASRLGVDGSRIAVFGDGFGGALAAVAALLAKQRRGPQIALQVLLTPMTDGGLDTPSYASFASGPWLTRAGMGRLWDAYLPDVARRREATAAPLCATLDQLAELPDALICVAENDVLRDEGEAYARKLSEAGVRTTSLRCNGAIHDFAVLNPLADTPAARAVVAQIISSLSTAFG